MGSMPVNLTIKNVPDATAAKLRERAARNHRSLQGEMMAILESAARDSSIESGNAGGLMDRLAALAGDRGIDTTKRLTRENTHDRRALRKPSSVIAKRSPS